MDSSPPTKPPRGIKPAKESSGLLMTVIRTLSASETNEQRENEKAKLETEFKRSNKKLDELVALHNTELATVMELFTTISGQIGNAKERIHGIKTNIQSCKALLGCRRDELHKLWFEGLKYKYLSQIFDEIEQLNDVAIRVEKHLSKRQYLPATKLLLNADALEKYALHSVDSLKELRNEIDAKKEKMYVILMEELDGFLYEKVTADACQFQRSGSMRDKDAFQRGELRLSNRQKGEKKAKIFDVEKITKMETTELEGASMNDNPEAFIAVLVECLALLKKIPDSSDQIKTTIVNKLLDVSENCTRLVKDMNAFGNDKSNLLDFLDVLFHQFEIIANKHALVIKCFENVSRKYFINVQVYEMNDYWNKLQAVLQLILGDYLNIKNYSIDKKSSVKSKVDLSSYFIKKKYQNKRRETLFSFDYSANDLSTTRYANERKRTILCDAKLENIKILFAPVKEFIAHVEREVGGSEKSAIDKYFDEFCVEIYLSQVQGNLAEKVETSCYTSNAWKTVISPNQMKQLTITKPILLSTATVGECLNECRELTRSMSSHAEQISKMAVVIMQMYRDLCVSAYRNIIQPTNHDKTLSSVAWLKDDDFNRLLKLLPNWHSLKSNPNDLTWLTEEQNPGDVKERNLKEAEMLASNLGKGDGIEIMTDITQMKTIAVLQESMEWFSDNLKEFISHLERIKCSEDILKMFVSVANEFEELSNICILLLHLEIRIQCFYYLLKHKIQMENHETNEMTDTDPRIQKLNRLLVNIDDVINVNLQPRKCRYIFEGLGYLIAKFLISSSQNIQAIDHSTVDQMCRNILALQQTLTTITMTREVALDHARRYFQMLYLTPDEILTRVMENGAEFSELEYMNLFRIIGRNSGGLKNATGKVDMAVYLARLSDILGDVGVVV